MGRALPAGRQKENQPSPDGETMETPSAFRNLRAAPYRAAAPLILVPAVLLSGMIPGEARNPIRASFFDYYPSAAGSALDNLHNCLSNRWRSVCV